MENLADSALYKDIEKRKQQANQFQHQFDGLQSVGLWRMKVPVKEQHLVELKKLFQGHLNELRDTDSTPSSRWQWLDQLFLLAVKQAITVKTYAPSYLSRVARFIRTNTTPMSDLNQFNTTTLPKPTFNERHPISEADLEINKMWQRQRQGRLSKVGSLVNYGGRTDYRFADFIAPDEVTRDVLQKGQAISEAFKQGHYFNAVFSGATGRGKTMLAVAIMNDVNENSQFDAQGMIISMAMYADLLMANLNGERIEERTLLEKRMMGADLLIWDDFGSDTSMKKELHEANDTTQKAIFRIIDARQGKANIITTNHTGDELGYMYNAKITSRLLTKKPDHAIDFNDLPDHRAN